MPFDRERKPEERVMRVDEDTGSFCSGIPQCAIRELKYRPGMCHIEGCPRNRLEKMAYSTR